MGLVTPGLVFAADARYAPAIAATVADDVDVVSWATQATKDANDAKKVAEEARQTELTRKRLLDNAMEAASSADAMVEVANTKLAEAKAKLEDAKDKRAQV